MSASAVVDVAAVARVLRGPTDADDKYSRGVVGLRTGSLVYPGAAVLGVEGAWRAGIGLVRYTGPARELVLAARPETVTADGRVHTWVVGSGTDAASRPFAETETLTRLLAGSVPVVVDAGALELAPAAHAPVIVTPHAREFARLRAQLGLDHTDIEGDDGRAAAASETARALGAVVLLKGARTVLAAPDGRVRVVAAGTPWLATAGTGDVLAGAIGAVAASVMAGRVAGDTAVDLLDAAAAGAWLHARAGELAASRAGNGRPGPITALDVARALPEAVGEALARGIAVR